MMKSLTTLLALTAGQAAAQFFAIYANDVVVQRADPILSPGAISQHVHHFFGAGNAGPNSDYDSLQSSDCTSSGRAAGGQVNADHSSYWVPSLWVQSNSNDSYIRVPSKGHKIYYENSGTGTMASPFEFPKGFRMMTGNPYLRAAQPHAPTNLDNITQWICHASPWNQGAHGGFPTGVTSCPDYPFFNAAINFPHCWNGDDFDPANPTAHVTYADDDIVNGPCPSSHPTRLPHIFIENNFYLEEMLGEFDPSTFTLAMGDATGFGMHGDFYNGWDEGVLSSLLTGPYNCSMEDIGNCTAPGLSFGDNTAQNINLCTAEQFYKENVDGPLPALPGCNPITDKAPAPQLQPCALGVVGGQGVSASAGGSGSASTAAPASSSAGGYGSGSSSAAAGTYGSAPASSSAAAGGSGSAPASSSAAAGGSGSAPASSSAATGGYGAAPSAQTSSVPSQAYGFPSQSASSATGMGAQPQTSTTLINGGNMVTEIVYVTDWVTVTAGAAPSKRAHIHEHAHGRRHNF